MAKILEIRTGLPEDPEKTREDYPSWPLTSINPSSYRKHIVGPTVNVSKMGIDGNAAGYPGHIEDTINRSILVYNEAVYSKLAEVFPAAQGSLIRGGFGENLVVNHPDMLPSSVCIGDKYHIGTTICVVTGPRAPCPKVDGWHAVKGLTQYCRENGTAGFFVKVVQEGQLSIGDDLILIERPNPTFTIERVSQGLWGGAGIKDDGVEFLSALSRMEDLIGRHYRETATTRLERILNHGNEE